MVQTGFSSSKPQNMLAGFVCHFQSSSFKVIVGPSKKTYHVNESALSAASPYFESLLSFPGKESDSKSVILSTEVDTEIAFEKFLQYAYLGNYEFTGVDCEDVYFGSKVPRGLQEKAMVHAQVYVLAERLMVENLKSLALDKMIAVLKDARVHSTSNQGQDPLRPLPRSYGRCEPNNQTSISADCVVRLISLVYRNTTDSAQVTTKPTNSRRCSTVTRDPMRALITRFASSFLPELKQEKIFLKMLRVGGDFAVDLVLESSGGKRIQSDEKSRLF